MYDQVFLTQFNNYIQFLITPIQQSKLGIGWNDINISLPLFNLKKKNFHLKCSIPYAKQIIEWEIHFNSLHPELGPDLIFDNEEFLQLDNIDYIAKELPSLSKWNPVKRNSLLHVLQEILKLYKHYQIKLLKIHKLNSYSKLVNKIDKKNLEIIVFQGYNKVEVKFFMKIDLNPPIKIFKNSKKLAVLILIFNSGTQNFIVSELYTPIYLYNLFAELMCFYIPPIIESEYVEKYALQLIKYINRKVVHFSKNIHKRKKFVIELLILFSKSIIEYDVISYRSASLLFEHPKFLFILHFYLPFEFPKKQFLIKLRIIYQATGNEKERIYKNICTFPYSSEWESKYMIIKAIMYIFKNEIEIF